MEKTGLDPPSVVGNPAAARSHVTAPRRSSDPMTRRGVGERRLTGEAPPEGGSPASGSEVISVRLEMTRTFPVSREEGWDYTDDFHTWPEWLDVEVADPEKSSWKEPGDAVQVTGRMWGLRFRGSMVLEEKIAPEMSRTLWRWPGWPDIHVEMHYEEAGTGAFTSRVVAYVDDEAGRLGKLAAWLMTNVPLMMQREVRRSFDRLDTRFRHAPADKDEAEAPAKGDTV